MDRRARRRVHCVSRTVAMLQHFATAPAQSPVLVHAQATSSPSWRAKKLGLCSSAMKVLGRRRRLLRSTWRDTAARRTSPASAPGGCRWSTRARHRARHTGSPIGASQVSCPASLRKGPRGRDRRCEEQVSTQPAQVRPGAQSKKQGSPAPGRVTQRKRPEASGTQEPIGPHSFPSLHVVPFAS